MSPMNTVCALSTPIYVITPEEMREFSDIFEACRYADSRGPWQYAA